MLGILHLLTACGNNQSSHERRALNTPVHPSAAEAEGVSQENPEENNIRESAEVKYVERMSGEGTIAGLSGEVTLKGDNDDVKYLIGVAKDSRFAHLQVKNSRFLQKILTQRQNGHIITVLTRCQNKKE